jgi:ribosome-associated heat shock protein Hsp15
MHDSPSGPLRIDKWLWAARFFKTRAVATAACDAGKIVCNGQTAKPSRIVKLGDKLNIRSESGDFEVEVLQLSDQRGSASIAAELFHETDTSRELRTKVAEAQRAAYRADPTFSPRRPTKRDRRLIHSFRGKD